MRCRDRTQPTGSLHDHKRFDQQNRFAAQTMDSGGFTSAEYITNKNGKVIQANVGSAEGFSRYSFSESGYEAGQEFTPIKGWGWKYDLVRDQGNAPATMTIHCHTQSFTVPIPAGMSMRDNGAGKSVPFPRRAKSRKR